MGLDLTTLAAAKSYTDSKIQSGAGTNNQPLHFTGAVEASYDGSEEVTVEIPQGGGSRWKKVYSCDITTVAEAVTAIEIDLGVPELGDIEEFAIYWYCSKTTLDTACDGQLAFYLDGMKIGYFFTSVKLTSGPAYFDIFGNIELGTVNKCYQVVNPTTNTIKPDYQRYLSKHEPQKRNGKLEITFPAEWAGEYKVTVFTR